MSFKLHKPIEQEEAINVATDGNNIDVCGCEHCDPCIDDAEGQFALINLMDTRNISDCKYNRNEFYKGISEMSKTAGMITALVNAGLSPSEALEYICADSTNRLTYKLQTELGKQNNDASIAIAKISGETAMKQQF